MGHQVYFLNQCNSDAASKLLLSKDIPCFKLDGVPTNKWQWIKQVWQLHKFIKQNKIDIVFSHLDPPSLVAVIAQYLNRVRVVVVRHYVDDMHLNGHARSLSYRLIYKLAREIIVVSNGAKEFMVNVEKVKANKISVIFLLYDFALYEKPDAALVNSIRLQGDNKLLLLTVCRLVKNKRPDLSVEVLNKLIKSGIEARLLIVGSGEMEEGLKARISEYGLEDYCCLTGYKSNIMDYMEACDILLNPSQSEASSVVIKEAGIRKKPVIACSGIGDCDEYIYNDENGYLVNTGRFVEEAVDIIQSKLLNERKRNSIGEALHREVLNRFDINLNIHHYQRYLGG